MRKPVHKRTHAQLSRGQGGSPSIQHTPVYMTAPYMKEKLADTSIWGSNEHGHVTSSCEASKLLQLRRVQRAMPG